MKNIFKFAAMAFAAVLLVASCEKKEDDKETLSIDGKQWVTNMEGAGIFLDLGLKKKDTLCSGYCDPTTLESMVSSCRGRGDTAGTASMDALNPSCATVFSADAPASCPRLNLLVSMPVPQPS